MKANDVEASVIARRLFSKPLQNAWDFFQWLLFRPSNDIQEHERESPTNSARADTGASWQNPVEIRVAIVRIYELALDRTPHEQEAVAWMNQVLAGQLSLASIIDTIAGSPEALQMLPHMAPAMKAQAPAEVDAVVVRIYKLALHRTPNAEECAVWTNQVLGSHLSLQAMIEAITGSPEAQQVAAHGQLAPEVSNGKFIQFAFEELLGRGPLVDEIAHWDYRIARGSLGRDRLVTHLFAQRAQRMLTQNDPLLHDSSNAWIMGTDRFINVEEWQVRAAAIPQDTQQPKPKSYSSLALSEAGPEVLVSAIASLYCGGEYIEQFLENITSQSIFSRCELIVVDANSPENEFEVIASYMKRFPNIVYHRASTRIGIYEAWNIGVEMSRGRHLTNANLDDLRRIDSFERQAEILEKFPFVDVTYQDFYFSFDGKASVAKTTTVGVVSELPIVTPYNLVRSNSPHNAPMWRRAIHDDMGLFDASYRSAGDHDFWLRCVEAGKVFYKVNDPHVVYFVNPEGLSTRPNTHGVEEGLRTTREHGRRIISPKLLSSDQTYITELEDALGVNIALNEREVSTPEWRYAVAQRALRLASIASR